MKTDWPDLFQQVLQALPLTLLMIVIALICAIILGLVLAVIRIQRTPILSPIVRVYQSFIRRHPCYCNCS
ncbi:hypothetical protein STAR110904_10120 [Staphylococcus argensis]